MQKELMFLFQEQKNLLSSDFDFSNQLKAAIEHEDWFRDVKIKKRQCNLHDIKYNKEALKEFDIIPVGSVEFVLNSLKEFYNIKDVIPWDIPEYLNTKEFLQDKYFIPRNKENLLNYFDITGVKDQDHLFVKQIDKIKGFADLLQKEEILIRHSETMNFRLQLYKEIKAEYRAFIFNNDIVGIKQYLGDPFLKPVSREFIEKIIKEIKVNDTSAPPAYTIDVGFNNKGNFLIELHDMFSVGLYGCQSSFLLHMFMQWFYWVLKTDNYRVVR